MGRGPSHFRKDHIAAILLSIFLAAGFVLLMGRVPAAANASGDQTLADLLEQEATADPASAAAAVFSAESSRQQVIADSQSAYASELESRYQALVESDRASRSADSSIEYAIHESIAMSIAESMSIEESVAASLAYESSVAASIAQSEAESREAAERAAREEQARREAEAQRAAAAAASAAAAANPSGTTGMTVLVGDSRASGFSFWGGWPAGQVFYTYNQIDNAPGLVSGAASLYPAKVVFLNGIDDIIAHGNDVALVHYEEAIRQFHSLSPNTAIYVSSVIRVNATGLARFPQLGNISGYNQMLIAMCARNGWTYVDASAGFSDAHFADDGIHFSKEWTIQWLNQLRGMVGF